MVVSASQAARVKALEAKRRGGTTSPIASMLGVSGSPTGMYGPTGIPIVNQAAGVGLQSGYALPQRQSPTVATPTQPIVSKGGPEGLVYDPANPQDFIFKLNARKAMGGKLTESDIYNYQLATSAQQQTTAKTGDPYAGYIAQLQSQLEAQQGVQETEMETALEAKMRELDAKYGILRGETTQAGRREKEAGQAATSFSGFGRSTFNADQQVEIQRRTNNALNQLEAAKQVELAMFRAEQSGASAEALAPMQEALQKAQDAAAQYQIDAIKAANDINSKTGASMLDTINNLLTTAGNSGLTVGPDDAKNLEVIAMSVKGMTPEQRNTYLGQFDEMTRALILGAANATPTDVETVGSGKGAGKIQYNPQTGKRETIYGGGGVGGMGGGGGGGVGGGYTRTTQANNMIGAIDDMLTDPNLKLAVGPSIRKVGQKLAFGEAQGRIADYQSKVDMFVNQQVLPNLKLLKGSMSDKDIAFIKGASVPLNTNMSESGFRQSLKNMRAILNGEAYVNDAGVLVKGARPTYMGGGTTPTQTTEISKTGRQMVQINGVRYYK